MRTWNTGDTVMVMALVIAVLVALLCAVVAGVLARADGATVPAALSRAGVAFATSMGVATAVLALLR
jgi:hypothetical protein